MLYGVTHKSGLPKWLKVLIYIFLTITIVYWLCILIYKTLELFRFCIHWATDKGNWWLTLSISLIALIVCLCLAQFVWGLNPFGNILEWIVNTFNNVVEWFKSIIRAKV